MIPINQNLIVEKRNLYLIILSLLISLSWSVKLDREWSTDYGVYYSGSAFFSEDYQLYKEHFDHKGPGYYAFLYIIGQIIGFGPLQAIISLFFTSTIFIISILVIAEKYIRDKRLILLLILSVGAVLFYQTTNTSIAFFQGASLLWSFHFLYRQRNNGRIEDLILSILFWVIAFFIRVDAVVFLPMFLFAKPIINKWWQHFGLSMVLGFGIILILHIFFATLFGYTWNEFYQTNIVFNKIHGSVRGGELHYLWYRPESYKLLLYSGLPFLLLLVICSQKKLGTFGLVVSGLGLLGFVLTNNDRVHHLLIFIIPLFFSTTLLLADFNKLEKPVFVFLLCILAYPNLLMAVNLIGLRADIRDDIFLSMKSENDKIIVDEMKELKTGIYLGERAWYYLFSNTKPQIGVAPLIYNPRYSEHEDYFRKIESYNVHKRILGKTGSKFICGPKPSNIFEKELYSNSVIIKELSTGQQVRIIK